jgi:hypothetical protein
LVEDVAFNQGIGSIADIESMASVIVPVVVVGVPVAVELEFRRTAGGVMDVVASEGDLVILAVAEAGKALALLKSNDVHTETHMVQ